MEYQPTPASQSFNKRQQHLDVDLGMSGGADGQSDPESYV
jgi:hypothetical protein